MAVSPSGKSTSENRSLNLFLKFQLPRTSSDVSQCLVGKMRDEPAPQADGVGIQPLSCHVFQLRADLQHDRQRKKPAHSSFIQIDDNRIFAKGNVAGRCGTDGKRIVTGGSDAAVAATS